MAQDDGAIKGMNHNGNAGTVCFAWAFDLNSRIATSGGAAVSFNQFIVEDGRILQGRMRHVRRVEADIMEAARSSQGVETLEQIKFAIIERNGKISVIAKEPS